MNNIDKYLSLLGDKVDGLLLTSRFSRHYGAEFDIAEGVAIVSASGCRYFTDSRYIESAQNNIRGFQVVEMNRENPYHKLITDAIDQFGIQKLGFEEGYITVAEYKEFEKLNAELVPMGTEINIQLFKFLIFCSQGAVGAGAYAGSPEDHRQNFCGDPFVHQTGYDREAAPGGADLPAV